MGLKINWGFLKKLAKPLVLLLLGKAREKVEKWQRKPGVPGDGVNNGNFSS
jgi:hypothetical protein